MTGLREALSARTSRNTSHLFKRNLLRWYKKNKRDFPWRCYEDPYKILISEVLLQKTNASKVLPVYEEFIKKYPKPEILQYAKISDVKRLIKNLGLLYRAKRLISIGKHLSTHHRGKVPSEGKQLLKINGLGKYAASAILCFAFNKRTPIVDNNIVRLIDRIFGFKSSKERPRDDDSLWKFAQSLLPSKNVKNYNYALLDFSAIVCTAAKPRHEICPLKKMCKYYHDKIAGNHKP